MRSIQSSTAMLFGASEHEAGYSKEIRLFSIKFEWQMAIDYAAHTKLKHDVYRHNHLVFNKSSLDLGRTLDVFRNRKLQAIQKQSKSSES